MQSRNVGLYRHIHPSLRRSALKQTSYKTHWVSLQKLRESGDVEVVEERIVRDGNIWTSAGISAGIDLTLSFVENMTDEKTAGKIQLGAEYYPSGRSYGMMHTKSRRLLNI